MRLTGCRTIHVAVLTIALAMCWRVGCDGVLDSRVRFDKCGVCGGDNTSCHIISGIFTRRSLPYGYNKVATIPRGACNINITEIMPNRNFLALKLTSGQYMINGNWVVGSSKEYNAAGTTFRYYRPLPSQLHQKGQKEYIIGKGPTNDSVDIMLLKQQENHGIMYEYTIPMDPTITASSSSKPSKSPGKHDRKPNWTKPEVKGKAPLKLAKADEPLLSKRPADQGSKPSAPKVFQPELSDRYQRYRSQFGSYLGLGQSPAVSSNSAPLKQPAQRTLPSPSYGTQYRQAGLGVVDVSRKSSTKLQPSSNSQQQQEQQPQERQLSQTVDPYARYNKANGHRLRHGGRHRGRHHRKQQELTSAVRPTHAVKQQYDYNQAQALGRPSSPSLSATVIKPGTAYGPPTSSLGQQRPSSSYVYPPVAGVVPVRPIPAVQTSSQRLRVYDSNNPYVQQQPLQSQGGGASQQYRPHIIPATRQQIPLGGVQQQLPGGQHRYDNVYYQQAAANAQRHHQAGAKWALNDQIALQLPGGARYPGQIGSVDPGSDFTWRISGFTECSKTCGGGMQTTIIVCVKGASQALVTDENCDNALKPETQSVTCNTRLCPPAWEPTDWSSCSTSCGRGTQTRDVQCRQMLSLNDIRPVSAAVCRDLPKPDTVRMCNEDKPCVRWKIGDWTKCSADCGRGQKTREVICVNSEDRPIAENKCLGSRPRHVEMCDMGSCAKTWFYTDWSTKCSTSCGEGVYIRNLHCSAEEDRCRAIHRPDETKTCRNRLPCGGQWFTGPWQKCSVTCGSGVTRRQVLCMKKLGRMMPVGEENCLVAEKPESERPCENPACKPQWYMTDWTECTKTCDTGYQQRDVKCLDAERRTTTRCEDDDKPDVWRTCNTMPCPTAQPGQSNSEHGGDPSCRDEYNNCRLVVQARLCHYSYYQKACCLSCAGGNNPTSGEDSIDESDNKDTDDGSSSRQKEGGHQHGKRESRERQRRRPT